MIAGRPWLSEGQKAFLFEFAKRDISKDDLPEATRRSLGGPVKLHRRKHKQPKHRLWLYCDAYPSRNAAMQYRRDIAKDDGMRRKCIARPGGAVHVLAYYAANGFSRRRI